MMCRGGVVMMCMSILASDDGDGWLTWRPSWLSVPLTVDSILRLDRVSFCLRRLRLRSPPWCFAIVNLGRLRCGYENHPSCSIGDNSLKLWQEFHLLVRCPRSDEKSMERIVKQVVNLILIYFNTSNAFYKIEYVWWGAVVWWAFF